MPPPFLQPSYALLLRLINIEPHDAPIAGVLRRNFCLWHLSDQVAVSIEVLKLADKRTSSPSTLASPSYAPASGPTILSQKNRTATSPPEKTAGRRLWESVNRALWRRLWQFPEANLPILRATGTATLDSVRFTSGTCLIQAPRHGAA